MSEDQFYLQDSRTNTGTGAMFWQNGGGYGTNLDTAELFTREAAVLQHKCRETDLPWPKAYVDERHHVGVDCQYVREEDAVGGDAFYASAHRRWDGNDLIWITDHMGSSDLRMAKVYSQEQREKTEAIARLDGLTFWPKSYIDAKSRRLVSFLRLDHYEALRSVNLTLPVQERPRRPRIEIFNCSGCGRFISDRQRYYGNCRNCDTDNRP